MTTSDITEKLQNLSKALEISISKLYHEPLGGGYLGHIRFEGEKSQYLIQISIDLDFPLEYDTIVLRIKALSNNSEHSSKNSMERIKTEVDQIKQDFYMPMHENWEFALSKEIKIRTDLYN